MEKFSDIKLPEEKLKKLGVGLVYLFGSRAEGTAGPSSDFDVGLVFSDPAMLRGDTPGLYQSLYEIFSDTFDLSGFRSVDIVFLEQASLELRFDAISHGAVLFEISPEFREKFEERVEALYRDFKPILREFDRAILERI